MRDEKLRGATIHWWFFAAVLWVLIAYVALISPHADAWAVWGSIGTAAFTAGGGIYAYLCDDRKDQPGKR
ncbi:MAG: hypothetical protein ACT4OF_14170 [Caulobacteraceae bacterium]